MKYNKIEGNDISAGNSAYMHAFGVAGFKNLAMYNIFKRNYCHGFSSANTVGGNTNFVFSNIFENVKSVNALATYAGPRSHKYGCVDNKRQEWKLGHP